MCNPFSYVYFHLLDKISDGTLNAICLNEPLLSHVNYIKLKAKKK